ncbi:MAG: hypothetical protein HPY45_07300 [Anaerolineae bacterium]|nr:hypothetical protein [Anaerolineae bacterium]
MFEDEFIPPPPSAPRNSKNSKGGLAAFLRGVLRLILVLLLGFVLGIALYYFGSMYFYWQVMQPSLDNLARLEVLETRQAQSQTESRLSQFNQRLTELEKQSLKNGETIAELQSNVARLEQLSDEVSSELKRLDELEAYLDDVEKQISDHRTEFSALQKTLTAEDAPLAELRREVYILKAMELLSRSRLFMAQNNFGLAQEDIRTARQVLLTMQTETPAEKQAILSVWIQRLDMALNNLPQSPILASDDLDIAWRMLAKGFSAEEEISVETLTIPQLTATPPTSSDQTQQTPAPTVILTISPTNKTP